MRLLNCPVKGCTKKVLVSEADIKDYDQGKIGCEDHQPPYEPGKI